MYRLIVGLGNPGDNYKNTRHNVGFEVIEHMKKRLSFISCGSRFQAEVCEAYIEENKFFLFKPTSFMNLSGQPVGEFSRYYKITPTQTLVAYDDLDLPLGQIRLSQNTSSGGHNGIKSIISNIGTEFMRLRIGIGDNRAAGLPAENYVLQKFLPEEESTTEKAVEAASESVMISLSGSAERAQDIITKHNNSL